MNAAIRWCGEHPVAAMLTIILIGVLGVFSALSIAQKTFPEIALDSVNISVSYPGASPTEIQESVIRPIEDKLTAVDGVDEITASISEGRGSVTVTFLLGENLPEKLDEIRTEVDSIDVFPEDVEDPTVTQSTNSTRVLEIAVHGTASERVLTEEAERLRNELLQLDAVSYVEVANRREYEVTVEVDRDTLRAYSLTMFEVSNAIRQNSMEVPGGAIDTDTVSFPIRTIGRNYTQTDFEDIVLRTGENGGRLYLRDVATVTDGFEDTDLSASFNGDRSVSVNVFRVGDEQVLEIVEAAQTYLRDVFQPSLQVGVSASVWQNDAREL